MGLTPRVAPDAFEELFDRERLLAGLPAKRAATLLFLIESRTARLTAQSRQAMARFATRDSAQQRELAFIEAFALGREPPLRPTIQDLELQAPRWASLVARNPRVQAALAQRLGEKYRLVRGRVRAIREALGLDDPLVGAAYERLYARPIDSIYVDRPPLRERVRWARAGVRGRLEGLSPFWTAYALTLTETVGSTIVALPIAVAAIGPMPAVAILVVLGLVNVLTVAFMADALTRSATIRYGDAYIGRVVAELLGRSGALVLTVGLVGICLMGMQADYIGVSSTLTDATGVPALGWVAALFAVELLILRRGSIDATVTSALVVGALNITLILAVCALAFAHVRAVEPHARVAAVLRRRGLRSLVAGARLRRDVHGVLRPPVGEQLRARRARARSGRAHARARGRRRAAHRGLPVRAVRRRGDGRRVAGRARARDRAPRCRRSPTRRARRCWRSAGSSSCWAWGWRRSTPRSRSSTSCASGCRRARR